MFGRITKIFLVVLVLLFLGFFTLQNIVYAENAFTFVTDPQSIAVNEKSKEVKIKFSDPAGTPETYYLSFESTSATGQFLNSGGVITPDATVTLNIHSVTRGSIYYEDSIAGDFVLTINITNKSKSVSYSLNQHILIGQQVVPDSNVSTTTPDVPNTQVDTSYLSSHSSYVEVSSYKPAEKFSVTIGRNRLGTVGISNEFQAESDVNENNISYNWSFGDGAYADGKKVEHNYDYPGDYVVVLNTKYYGDTAVSRTNIKIIEPQLSIEEASQNFIKIKNDSAYEVNLYGWKLSIGGAAFKFPVDTIILPGASTIFPSKTTSFHPNNISEVVLSSVDKEISKTILATNTELKPNDLADMYTKAVAIRDQLATISPDENIPTVQLETPKLSPNNTNNIAAPLMALNATTTPHINGWFEALKRFLFIPRLSPK